MASVDITTIGYEVDTRQVKSASRDLDNLEKSSKKASHAADGTNTSLVGMAKGAGALAAALGVAGLGRVLIQQIDQYTKLTAQIKLATRTTAEYKSALTDVSRIAKTAQTDLSSVATLYARLSNSLRDLGVSQRGVADVTEVVGLGLKLSGASAVESASAMLQLSQAFNSGRLAGQEFTAMAENAPALMRALAASMGVPVGALKQLAADGVITSDVLYKAFGDKKLLETYRQQAKEVQTIGGAFQVLKNNALEAIGQLDKATGFSKGFSSAINAIANAITTLADIAQNKRIDLDRVFPGYANFLKYQQANAGLPQREVNEPGKGGTQFLARGARMDQVGRIDYGNIGQVNADFEKLRGTLAKLREDEPLKDIVSAQTKYAENLKTVNQLEEKGLLTVQEATRYRAQFNQELAKATTKTNELNESQKQMLKELQNTIDIEGDLAVDAYNKQQKVMLDWYERTNEQIVKDIKKRYDQEQDYFDRTNRAIQKGLIERGREQQREADRIGESLSRSITDGIFRGFENGKGFVRNFIDVLINGLKTAFVQPFVTNIIKASGIGSLFSSAGAFASAGSSGLVASGAGGGFSIGNVLSGLKTSFDAFSGNLVGGVEKLGVMIANGQGGIADAIGGFMGQYSGQITTALAFAPAVFSLLKGDTKGALLSGGGAAIGSLFGPGGAVIGGAIGSLLGGAFGSRPKNPRIGALVSGTYSTATDKYTQTGITKGGAKKLDMTNASAIGQVNQAFLQQLGGYLDAMDVNANIQSGSGFYTKKGKKSIGQLTGSINGKGFAFSEVYGKKDTEAFQKYVNSVLGSVLVSAIQASPLSSGLRALFSGMTDKTQILNMMNATIALNNEQGQLAEKYSITVDQAARVARATGATGNALVDMVNKLAGAVQTTGSVLMQARESLMAGMGGRQLPSTMKAFDDILQSIDKSTQAGIQSFADLFKLREQFAAFTQSIDQLKGGVNSTLMPFLSAQEQQAIQQAELAKVFDSLNMSVPGSLQELIDLGKAIDYTTKEGLDLAAVFPQLVQAFQQTTIETNALIDSLGQLDINKFGTMFEYLRAGSYMRNGISLSQLPSYDVGTSYVPQTGPALIHQGERIMTASENREYSNAMGMVVQEMRMLRQDNASMRAELRSIALSSYKSASSIDRIERDGMIIRDVDQNGDEQIIKVEVVNP
jgi:tape measure domain-containing protein